MRYCTWMKLSKVSSFKIMIFIYLEQREKNTEIVSYKHMTCSLYFFVNIKNISTTIFVKLQLKPQMMIFVVEIEYSKGIIFKNRFSMGTNFQKHFCLKLPLHLRSLIFTQRVLEREYRGKVILEFNFSLRSQSHPRCQVPRCLRCHHPQPWRRQKLATSWRSACSHRVQIALNLKGTLLFSFFFHLIFTHLCIASMAQIQVQARQSVEGRIISP